MERKLEDQIAQLAFGELSQAEAAKVQANAKGDAGAAKALDSYQALRGGLNLLKDVPPDQLSKERLRNAILTQGLKPKPVRSGFPWGLATVGALACAFGVMFLLKPPAHDTKNVVALGTMGSSDIAQPLNAYDRQMVEQTISGFGDQPSAPETASAPQPAAQNDQMVAVVPADYKPAPEPPRRHYFARTYRGHSRPISGPANVALATINPTVQPENAQPIETPKKSPESLVLIQGDKNSDTGASNAVEVKQTEDVIVSS